MITSTDPKSNAMLLALQSQRDNALETAAVLAGELGEAKETIKTLQAQVDALKPKEATP